MSRNDSTFTRRKAAEWLSLTAITRQRLAIVATGDSTSATYQQWITGEYTEQDHFLFQLFCELRDRLTDTSTVFAVLAELWPHIDKLIQAANATTLPGVVVIGDGRYVTWPKQPNWIDTLNIPVKPNQSDVERSLRITVAIHLQALREPLSIDVI